MSGVRVPSASANVGRELGAAAQASRAGLLAGAGVPMQGTTLDGLVDRLHQSAVFAVGDGFVAARDCRLERTEVGLDRRGVATILEPLSLGALDPLLL